MIQLNKRHKAVYIKDEIIKCLTLYGIDINQVYSNTTDNGANVIKTSKLLRELQEDHNTYDSSDVESCEEPYYTDDLDDAETFALEENIHASLASVLSVVRCAAHTIQLAAYDVLKVIKPQVDDCRYLVKKLRTSARTGGITFKMPVLDNTTRWNSTYEMLKSLINAKDHINAIHLEDLDIQPDINWSFIEDFVLAFDPLANCTKQLQSEQYVVGDFYRDWIHCELQLKDLHSMTPYAELLYTAMMARKEGLIQNDAFVAAIYLDPRFNFENSVILSQDNKNAAVVSLLL